MGATSFDELIWTDKGYKEAYREVVDMARYEYGVGDNGTISTTTGVVEHKPTHNNAPVATQDAFSIGIDRTDELQSRGHCEAIAVYEISAPKKDIVLYGYTAEISVDADVLNMNYSEQKAVISEQLTKHVRKIAKRDGELRGHTTWMRDRESYVSIPADDVKGIVAGQDLVQFNFHTQAKTTTTVSKGARVTRYFIIADDQFRMPKWEDGYASQAEARNALPKGLKEGSVADEYEIISMTRREQGEPLVSHQVRVKESKTVKVTVQASVDKITEYPKKTGRLGWYFYGMASE